MCRTKERALAAFQAVVLVNILVTREVREYGMSAKSWSQIVIATPCSRLFTQIVMKLVHILFSPFL
jgi:hypothetical protein